MAGRQTIGICEPGGPPAPPASPFEFVTPRALFDDFISSNNIGDQARIEVRHLLVALRSYSDHGKTRARVIHDVTLYRSVARPMSILPTGGRSIGDCNRSACDALFGVRS